MDGSVVGVADVGETDVHRLDEVGGSNGPSSLYVYEEGRDKVRGGRERGGKGEREMDGGRGGVVMRRLL